MTPQHNRPQDTNEFLAQWNAATEGHLTDRLTEILLQLTERESPHTDGGTRFAAILAPHVLHALQVAAAPGATVHDAIEFLAGVAGGTAGSGPEAE